MGLVRMGIPEDLVLQLRDALHIRTFIETGTFRGGTARWASQQFEHVITIEFSESIYRTTKAAHAAQTNIDFRFGDTRQQLQEILPTLTEPALFWLDAHWSGGETYGASDECPLLQELALINQSPLNHIILIDDARLFLAPPPAPHEIDQWPDLATVLQSLTSGQHDRYSIVVEDVIVAVPTSARAIAAAYGQAANTRLQHGATVGKGDERAIAQLAKSGELQLIQNLTLAGPVVFDVGANQGAWTTVALKYWPQAQVHMFEPIPVVYQALLPGLGDAVKAGRVIPNPLALADREAIQPFYYFEDASSLSSLHRRLGLEKNYGVHPPQEISVFTTTLDRYCQQHHIRRIHFLKIDVEGGELAVLHGARAMLQRGQIDYIQFEYGGTWKDAEILLQQAVEYLHSFGYGLYKIGPDRLEYRPHFLSDHEDFAYSNFLAAHPRFLPTPPDQAPTMLDLPQLCAHYGIRPRNVIHVGAHEGQEIALYQQMQVEGALLVEANPTVFERLEANLAGIDNMLAVNCAISDRPGDITLRVTSADQSSSILPLKHHRTLYPAIQETEQITVPATTLDLLLDDLMLDPADFNVLNLDIQGAEYLALQGASNLLTFIEAINTEVNYEELYEGCALIDELDEWLAAYGFERVATTTPYHPSWGDAFYVKRPVVTMTTLGRNGRFANQIFQYAFLKLYASTHHLGVETPEWIGRYLFNAADPLICRPLPTVGSPGDRLESLAPALAPGSATPHQNVDFWGYFQYHTRFYASHKAEFRTLFQPAPAVQAQLNPALKRLRSRGNTIVGLHLRRGDYGYEHFFIAPSHWYLDWLRGFWDTLDNPVLFIASDEPDKVVPDFQEYHPITTQDLAAEIPEAPFYPDFYLLSQCDVVAISNSSFSFAACLLNERAALFFRPHLPSQKLIPFEPWNSDPIFRDARVEEYARSPAE